MAQRANNSSKEHTRENQEQRALPGLENLVWRRTTAQVSMRVLDPAQKALREASKIERRFALLVGTEEANLSL